jgi:hypothetical protein
LFTPLPSSSKSTLALMFFFSCETTLMFTSLLRSAVVISLISASSDSAHFCE